MALFQNIPDEWNRLDWLILQNGWISLYHNKKIFETDIAWFENEKYSHVRFDCILWNNEEVMHDQLKMQLDFPDYYGRNFDAINDCLHDLEISEVGLLITFENVDSMPAQQLFWLLDTFASNARLHLLWGRKLIMLGQVNNPNFEMEPIGICSVCWNGAEWLNESRLGK